MDTTSLFLLVSSALTLLYLLPRPITRWFSMGRPEPLPPGPYPLPVVGNLFELGDRPHRSLARLAQKYGPTMALRLGSITTIVVSSPAMAMQVLQKHDSALSRRPVPDALRGSHHAEFSVTWLAAKSESWRILRSFLKTNLFTSERLDANGSLRSRKVKELVEYLRRSGTMGRDVDVGVAVFVTTLNLISNTLFSTDVADLDSGESAQEFRGVISGLLEEIGSPNTADYFPLLRWADPQGRRRRMTAYFKKLHDLFDGMIQERQRQRQRQPRGGGGGGGGEPSGTDLLDSLLDDDKLDLQTVKALLADTFVGGSDTSASTVEWGMAELLRHPDVMAKVQLELDGVASRGGLLEESDIQRLPYLQAVVKETLRLHPPVPLLIPHKAESTVVLGDGSGYRVPEGATVVVNAWAIGRDADTWAVPDEFLPERFLQQQQQEKGICSKEVDYRGRNFELIPFGSGRRICPGLPLASRMVHLMLASLLHQFNWKLPQGMNPSDVDLTDTLGLISRVAVPVRAVPVAKHG